MLTAPLFKQSIQNLKFAVKGRAQSSREMRQEANQLSGMDKHHMHLRMREYGATTRYYLLAYALVRGLSYRDAEVSCREDNKPNAHAIHRALIHGLGLGEDSVEALWDADRIAVWLEDSPQAMRAAA